jgi:hypothetical protein
MNESNLRIMRLFRSLYFVVLLVVIQHVHNILFSVLLRLDSPKDLAVATNRVDYSIPIKNQKIVSVNIYEDPSWCRAMSEQTDCRLALDVKYSKSVLSIDEEAKFSTACITIQPSRLNDDLNECPLPRNDSKLACRENLKK